LGLEVAPEPSHLTDARERLRDFLHRHCPDTHVVAEVVLCLEEACTNVIRHSGAREAMHVALRFDDDALVCLVRDRGCGFDTASFDPEAVPDPLSSQGRGLYIISRIMDELRLCSDGGLEVEMVKRAVPRRTGPRGDAVTGEAAG
jgi:anti-sigma regulatory factor (Ser/Thr protein kinase)